VTSPTVCRSSLVSGVVSLQTGNALSFFLHNIASNPDKQDKLYAEIQQVLPDTAAVPTGETLQKMAYLKATVNSMFSSSTFFGLF